MLKREEIIQELLTRLASTSGAYVARNPKKEPDTSEFPYICLVELADMVEDVDHRGGMPNYKRKIEVVVECFTVSDTDEKSSQDIMSFLESVKSNIYGGSANLGGKCATIIETESSRVLRPPIGSNAAGIGLVFEIRYIENTGLL
jgi:hypothetical protein